MEQHDEAIEITVRRVVDGDVMARVMGKVGDAFWFRQGAYGSVICYPVSPSITPEPQSVTPDDHR